MSYFEWYETKADGTPKENPRRIEYADSRVIVLQWKWSLSDIQHFIALACAVPGTPVDVTKFERGQLVFSARLVYHISDDAPEQKTLSLQQPSEGRVWPARSR